MLKYLEICWNHVHSFIAPFPDISREKSLQVAIDPGDSWKIFTKALRRMARSAGTKGAMEITAATKRPEKKKAVKSVMTNLAIL